MIWHEDEPIWGPPSVALHAVAELAGRTAKVVLTGEGSDELFAGYDRYWMTAWNARVAGVYGAVPSFARKALRGLLVDGPLPERARRALSHTPLGRDNTPESLVFDNWFGVFNPDMQRQMGTPALAGMLLKAPTGKKTLLTPFYNGFNKVFGKTTDTYVSFAGILARKMFRSLAFIGVLVYVIVVLVRQIPGGFVPEEDQGFIMVNAQLPDAASLERTDAVMRKAEAVLKANEAVEGYNTITGFSLLRFLKYIKEEILIVLGTSSSEAALPGGLPGVPPTKPAKSSKSSRLETRSAFMKGRFGAVSTRILPDRSLPPTRPEKFANDQTSPSCFKWPLRR